MTLEEPQSDESPEEEFNLESDSEDKPPEKASAEEEFDLDLDLEDAKDKPSASKPKAVVESKSAKVSEDKTEVFDLDLNLDMDMEEETPPKKPAHKVALAEKPAKISADKTEVFDLDLDMDMDSDGETAPAKPAAGKASAESEVFDLDLDMESESQPESTPLVQKKAEPKEPEELDFEMESDSASEEKSEEDFGFNFDGEHDAEFEDSGAPLTAAATATPLKEKEVSEESTAFNMGIPAENVESQVDAKPVVEDKKPTGKKKLKWQTAVAAAIVAVLIGGGVASQFVDLSQVPFVGGLVASKPGAVVPIEATITGGFMKNTGEGTLFVIRGEVKNEYSKPRDAIRIRGKLFTPGKKLAMTETAFAGNILSDSELGELGMADIKKKLATRAGLNNSNIKVMPEKKLSFMIVFSKLPENLDEFTVEVADSSPSK